MGITTVGSFTMDSSGAVSGPAEYMADEQGFAMVRARIEGGSSAVFNHGVMQPGATVEAATLVAVQTHYAAWRGLRECMARTAAARASQEATAAEVRAQAPGDVAERPMTSAVCVREVTLVYGKATSVRRSAIRDSAGFASLLREVVGDRLQESFVVVPLDSRGRPMGWAEVGRGSVATCPVAPSDVLRIPLMMGARRVHRGA